MTPEATSRWLRLLAHKTRLSSLDVPLVEDAADCVDALQAERDDLLAVTKRRTERTLTPYFEDAGVTIYHGDALEVLADLPSNSVDGIVTDPPYCSGGYLEAQKNTKAQGVRGSTVSAAGFEWFADNMGTSGLTWLLRELALRFRDVLQANRSAFIFTDWRMVPSLAPAIESAGFRFRNQLIWDKGNAGLGNGFKPRYEVVMEFAKGQAQYATNDGQSVLRFNRVNATDKQHGAEKPVELISEILRVSGPTSVLDPFMGSGTTLFAAKRLGRKAIGIETEERYCEIAASRLSQGVLDLFDEAQSLPSPRSLYDHSDHQDLTAEASQ